MILPIPKEPADLRDWMQSLKQNQLNDPTINWDAYVVWAGNKLPKYLWENWKEDLKPLGITWQKFMRILRHRTDVGVMWYQGKLPWPDFIKKISELITGPIGQEVGSLTGVGKKVEVSALPPQDLAAFQIPAISDWQKFERLCKDLWGYIWENPELQLNGRTGQIQAGVDVFGYINCEIGNLGGVQCKKKDNLADSVLTVKELGTIVEEAKKFDPPLKRFVVAYTGHSDVALQGEARRLTELHEKTGIFSVTIFSWDDIIGAIGKYPDLIEQYFPYITSVNTKKVEEIKRISDSILENQTEQSKNLVEIQKTLEIAADNTRSITELVRTSGVTSGGSQEYHAELDEIRDAIDSYRPKEALDRIEALEKRLPATDDRFLKFRLLTNKAAALSALGNEQSAGKLFIEAYQYNPDPKDEKALCNKALGYLLIGEKSEAQKIAEEIISNNPLSQRAYEIFIYCISTGLTFEEILKKIPESLRNSEGVAYTLAQAAKDKGNTETAIAWLETAMKNTKTGRKTPDLQANLAASLLQSLENKFDVLSGTQLTADDRKKIQRAADLLSESIAALENSETLKFRTSWLANRSLAYKLLGDLEKAFTDIDRANKLQPEDAGFIKQKAFILHERNQIPEAIALLKTIVGKSDVPESSLLLAGALYETNDFDNAISVLQESFKTAAGSVALQDEQKRLLIQIYIKKQSSQENKDYEPARQVANELRSADPTNILNLLEAGKIEKIAGNQNAYFSLLEEARSYVADNSPSRHLYALADELYSAKKYEDAWPIYERLVDVSSGAPATNKLIYSYYKAEQYEKALQAARSVPEHIKDRFIYEIEISVLDSMGALTDAISVSEKYLKNHPDDITFQISLAVGFLRNNDIVKLDAFLNKDIDLSKLPMDVALDAGRQLAGLYAQRGMSMKALEAAYWLRKRFATEANAHVAYVSIFFHREKDLDTRFQANSVAVDTAVHLAEPDGQSARWYVIEDSASFGQNFSELKSDSPIAKQLLGKKVGEEIIFDEGKPFQTKLKITEIKSKYVHALHETMEIFPQIFSDNAGLKRFSVKTTDSPEENKAEIEKMLQVISSQEESVLQVQKMYETGQITLGTFANLIGKNPIVIWGGLASNPRIGVHCCIGNQNERQEALKLGRENKIVVLDITALLTAGNLEIFNLLEKTFDQIFVTQSTIDTLTEEIAEKSGPGSKGFMTIWKEDGQFYKTEVTEEDIKRQTNFLTKIRDWTKTDKCQILPYKEALKLGKERREQLEQAIGKPFLDAILLAKEKNCPILSDDNGTRIIAKNEFGVASIWTQVLAIVAQERGIISGEDFEKINIDLVLRNYRHITVSAATLKEAAKRSGWSNAEPLVSVLNTLSLPTIEIKSSVGVIVNFWYLLWKEPLMDFQKEALVFASLDALSRKSNKLQILKLLAILVPDRFQLIPLAGEHLLKLITAWRSIRI